MADTLATLKEQHHVSPVAQLSQILAPRYLTRSRASSEVKEEDSSRIDSSDDTVSVDTDELKHESSADESAIPTTASDASIAHDSPTKSDCVTVETTYVGQKRKTISNATNASVSQQRKRGRHKEYTAPTGVWKTNGGYISTIYVGNRRIYGPLRDNPEDAGVDRQKLIDAKSFVKTEIEMRNFIANLKQQSGGSVRVPVAAVHSVTDPSSLFIVSGPTSVSRRSPQRRPVLTTITSAPTTIEPMEDIMDSSI
jgi:hypothetical protein